jgi:hypothetical protein
MKEYEPPQTAITPNPAPGKVPVSAYIMAVISGVFVTFGVMIISAFSHLFVGDLIRTAPKPVIMSIPFVAIGLGFLSGWQSIRHAKRKAMAGAKKGKGR